MVLTFRSLPAWPYPPNDRQPDRFKAEFRQTVKLLERELEAVGARDPIVGVVSPDLRVDGSGFLANARIQHVGAELSFDKPEGRTWRRLTFHTDAFRDYNHRDSFESNLRAIALGLEALRTVDRYGITTSGQQYAGFAALTAGPSLEDLGREIVERHGGITQALRATHPDTGGDSASERDFNAVQTYRKAAGL
jgi:hypothetical protein